MSSKTREPVPPTKRPPDEGTAWRFGLRHQIYAVFYMALACWLFVLVRAPIVVATLIVLASTFVGVAVLFARRRSSQQETLLGLLAIAAEREMSLVPALEAYSALCAGRPRRKLLALAHALDQGVPLPRALDAVAGVLSWDAEVFARIGWETGTLPGVFREMSTLQRRFKEVWAGILSRIAYILFLSLLGQGILAFLLYSILPVMESIFRDFRMPLPPISLFLFRLRHEIFGVWLFREFDVGSVLVGSLLLVDSVALLAIPAWLLAGPDRGVPLLDRFFVRRHSALILRALAWVVEGGKPLTWGVTLLARSYPTPWVRERLRRMGKDLVHGVHWVDSLNYHGLVRPAEAALLASASRVGNLPWALREAAEAGERRLAYRLQVISQAVFPLVLLALSVVVGLVGVAFLAPLAQLIERLSG